jgi:hypothetical protein
MADKKEELPRLYVKDFEIELKVKPVFMGDSDSKEDAAARLTIEQNVAIIAKMLEPKIKQTVGLLMVQSGIAKNLSDEPAPPPDKMN